MKILCLECSATPASVAIIDNGKIIGSSYTNVKLTHSQTLMPMIKSLLDATLLDANGIDGIAISNGPGSFTGIRIGISTAKGFGFSKDLPCVGVSTLRAMAENFKGANCIVCAVMDARCNQVYNAIFDIDGVNIHRLCDDRAILCDELAEKMTKLIKENNKQIIICGDGTDLFYKYVSETDGIQPAPQMYRFQNAAAVGLASLEDFENNNTITTDCLLPVYLRLPQAERELKSKNIQEEKL